MLNEYLQNSVRSETILDDMRLNVITYNCFKRAGFEITSGFIGKTEDELIKIRNIGRLALDDALRELENFGITLVEGKLVQTNEDNGDILYDEIMKRIYSREADETGEYYKHLH